MNTTAGRLEILLRTPDEMEAAMIAGVLADHGIRSRTEGGYTSNFRARGPGTVRILVAQADLVQARELLDQTIRDSRQVDWDAVDVLDPTPLGEDEAETPLTSESAQPAPAKSTLQYSLGFLVLVQTLLCILFAAWRIELGGGVWVIGLLGFSLVSLGVCGTVYIAHDLGRFRDRWPILGRPLMFGGVALIVLQLLWAVAAS
jgi:hypothetical protein